MDAGRRRLPSPSMSRSDRSDKQEKRDETELWSSFERGSSGNPGCLLVVAGAAVKGQRTQRVRGSPSALESLDSRQLSPPPPNFGGKVGRNANQSRPWWPPKVVPSKRALNVLLIMPDDVGFGGPSTCGRVIPSPNLDRVSKMGLRYTN